MNEPIQIPDVTVVIVNYNTAHLLDRLFSTLDAARGDLRIQTIVVDNASRDNSVEILRRHYPDVELIENAANVGFGRANNQAVPKIRGQYLLLLNTDAFVAPDTLSKTLSFMQQDPHCGILGVKLVSEDGSLQPSCRFFPTPWNVFLASTGLDRFFSNTRLVDDMEWDHSDIRECDWIPGCFYLIRKQVVDQIGLFDPRFFLYYEEVDHCQRARQAGWKVYFYPDTQVVHIGGESAKTDGPLKAISRQLSPLQIESELLYFRKHFGFFGLLTSVSLTIFANTAIAFKEFLLHHNTDRAKTALSNTRQTIGSLIATRLASQPTR